jgi:two-component system cell cycle sensor histidine kinase/response regulator CckA
MKKPDQPNPGEERSLRQRAEVAYQADQDQSKAGKKTAGSAEATQQIIHELRVHQIELEIQAEELRRTQLKLEASRRRYFDLYDLAPNGYCTLSAKGLIQEANLTLSTMLGLPRAGLMTKPFSHVVIQEDVGRFYALHGVLIKTGRPQLIDLRLIRRDHGPLWVHVAATTMPDDNGALVVHFALSDITELKLGEIKFRRLFDESPVGKFITQLTGQVAGNRAFCRMLRYTAPELAGKKWEDISHPDDVEMTRRELALLLSGEKSLTQFNQRYLQNNGAVVWGEVSTALLRDADGQPPYFITTVNDITDRLALEKTIHLRGAALEAAANAIIIADKQGIIEWVNPAFTALSGWSLAEAVGKNQQELMKSGQHDAAVYQQMGETLLAGKVWHGEIVNRRKDGALRTEDVTITPLRDEHGAITNLVTIALDITERKTLEAQFLQAQRTEAIGALASGIAHDLNNVLSSILLVTGVVKSKMSDEDDLKLLALATSSARRGGEIVRQLLTYSRGQKGERTPVQAGHLVTEMVAMMRATFPRNIDLQLQPLAGLWPVIADPTQLHQVLMNLCVNARDAMPAGGRLTVGAANVTLVEGGAKLPPRTRPGPYVVLKVSDTGAGIPPEIKHRIFDPFFTTKPLGKGTGLGLSTLLGIVHSHAGFVEVDSTPNVGSTFSIYLPAISDPIEVVADVPVIPAVPLADSHHTILVVDDDREVRETTRVLLERQHYRVMTAVNGEDALLQYLRHRKEIAVVLTDLMMPVMSGQEMIRALRAINPTQTIIPMSGLNEMLEEQDLAALGAPGLLIKPFDGPTLLETVHCRLTRA